MPLWASILHIFIHHYMCKTFFFIAMLSFPFASNGQFLEYLTSFGDELGDPDDADCMVVGKGLLFVQDDAVD